MYDIIVLSFFFLRPSVLFVLVCWQYTVKNEQDRFYPTTLGLALVDGYDNIGELFGRSLVLSPL